MVSAAPYWVSLLFGALLQQGQGRRGFASALLEPLKNFPLRSTQRLCSSLLQKEKGPALAGPSSYLGRSCIELRLCRKRVICIIYVSILHHCIRKSQWFCKNLSLYTERISIFIYYILVCFMTYDFTAGTSPGQMKRSPYASEFSAQKPNC